MGRRGRAMPRSEPTTNPQIPVSPAKVYDPLKRLLDLSAAAAGLIVLAPVLLLAAAAVKLTSPGPALYRARRAGVGGRTFDVLKLRTMVAGADRQGTITAGADARITAAGRFLRRTKLDELPQLWNVLRGDMSLVGPRPESLNIAREHYTAEQRGALAIRPGLTCTGNLFHYVYQEHLEPPAGESAEDFYVRRLLGPKLALDLHYVRHRSLVYDLKLLAQTAWVVTFKMLGLAPRWRPPVSVDETP